MSSLLLIPGTLPSNCYPKTPQELYNEMFNRGVAQAPDAFTYIKSVSAPGPEGGGHDKIWIKVDGTGKPQGMYVYNNALWVWPYEIPASSSYRALWVGTDIALQTFDGGNVGSGEYAGPFWEIDTDFAGRSPMAPGIIQGANPGKTLSVNENYGEGAHTMTSDEVAPHTHAIVPRDQLEGTGSGDIEGITVTGTGPSVGTLSAATNEYTTTQQNMPVIHPVRGIYIIKRTSRVYRTA